MVQIWTCLPFTLGPYGARVTNLKFIFPLPQRFIILIRICHLVLKSLKCSIVNTRWRTKTNCVSSPEWFSGWPQCIVTVGFTDRTEQGNTRTATSVSLINHYILDVFMNTLQLDSLKLARPITFFNQ